ncbi:MAG: SGNH/GDSL hydrolase family protein [Myxococcota bacterium]
MYAWLRLCCPLIVLAACNGVDEPTDPTDDSDSEQVQYEADPDVNTYVPEGYGATDPKRIIYLGDSISAGVGASSGKLSYPELLVENDESEWAGWGEQDLESVYGDLEVIDVAVSGARTGGLISDQLPAVSEAVGASASGETIVVMTIGGNDMQAALLPMLRAEDKDAAYEEQLRPVIDNFETIIDYFQDPARFPDGAFIYMTNVYEPTDNAGQVQQCFFGIDIGPALPYLQKANAEFRELAVAKGTASVDLYGHFQGHGHNSADAGIESHDEADPSLWLANDCIHPNDRGHHEVRRLFLTAIEGRPLEAFGEAP